MIRLSSLTGRAAALTAAEAEGDGLEVEPLADRAGAVVRQTVRRAGEQSNQVRLTAESQGRVTILTVVVKSIGVARD